PSARISHCHALSCLASQPDRVSRIRVQSGGLESSSSNPHLRRRPRRHHFQCCLRISIYCYTSTGGDAVHGGWSPSDRGPSCGVWLRRCRILSKLHHRRYRRVVGRNQHVSSTNRRFHCRGFSAVELVFHVC